MMSRDQFFATMMCFRRLGLFMPKDMRQKIYHTAPDLDLNSEVAQLLKHIAYYPNPAKVKEMLDRNPGLLMQSGDVKTAAGHTVVDIKPLECGLGEGDHYKDDQGVEMIPLIASYFSKIPGLSAVEGEQERVKQYARYQSAIDGIPNQKPTETIDWIMNVIVNNDDPKVLEDALETFRQDKELTPRLITRPGMHCNYANPQRALDVFAERFRELYTASGNNDAKCILAWDKVVMYVMGGLPACDRMRVAGGLVDLDKPLIRTFDFKLGGGAFPHRATTNSRTGAGFDLVVDLFYGGGGRGGALPRGCQELGNLHTTCRNFQKNLCRAKTSSLQNLCSQSNNQMRVGV